MRHREAGNPSLMKLLQRCGKQKEESRSDLLGSGGHQIIGNRPETAGNAQIVGSHGRQESTQKLKPFRLRGNQL